MEDDTKESIIKTKNKVLVYLIGLISIYLLHYNKFLKIYFKLFIQYLIKTLILRIMGKW